MEYDIQHGLTPIGGTSMFGIPGTQPHAPDTLPPPTQPLAAGKPTPDGPLSAPRTSTSPLTDAAGKLAQHGLDNPNPYTQDLIQRLWNDAAGGIDAQYDQQNQNLVGDLSRRGITDSTFGGQLEQQLAGRRQTAKEQALSALMSHAADVNAQSETSAIQNALGISDDEWRRIMDVNNSDQNSQLAWQQFLEWMYGQGRT